MSEGCGLLHVAVTEARLGLLRGKKEPQALGPEKRQRGGEAKRWELAAREALPNPTSDALPLLSGGGAPVSRRTSLRVAGPSLRVAGAGDSCGTPALLHDVAGGDGFCVLSGGGTAVPG